MREHLADSIAPCADQSVPPPIDSAPPARHTQAPDVLDALVQQGKADPSGEVLPAHRDEAFFFAPNGSLDLTRLGAIHPQNGAYTRRYADQQGTVIKGRPLGDAVINIFAKHGWTVWGGDWNSVRDWQHFQVPGCNRRPELAPGERYCEP